MEKPKAGNRRLIAIGPSLAVTIPARFIKASGWKRGDRVSVVCDDIVVVIQPTLKKKEK